MQLNCTVRLKGLYIDFFPLLLKYELMKSVAEIIKTRSKDGKIKWKITTRKSYQYISEDAKIKLKSTKIFFYFDPSLPLVRTR